jgi:riboflavin synthase
MFTGLIEEIGTIKSLTREASNLNIEISCKLILEDMKLGDSISVDGVCQTVTEISPESFTVTAIDETLKLTNFNEYQVNTKVNLERCLRPSDRLGGHIVQGHVDGVGELIKTIDQDGSFDLHFRIPLQLSKYIIHKGSISINGISLTVAGITEDELKVCIIPKTWELTNLSSLKPNSQVNLEVDMIAKYVEKLSLAHQSIA